MNHATKVTDHTFNQEVIESKQPVLVDFWAQWCGPCRTVGPIVDSLAERYEGRIKVVKLNVDENPETARQYSIRSIPSLLLFKKGEVKDQAIGALPEAQLAQLIENNLDA